MVELIKYASASLLWGILIGLLCLAIFFIMVKGWWKDAHFTFKSYMTGAALGIILIYQCTLLSGAVMIINMADDCEPVISSYVNQYANQSEQVLSKEETDKLISDFAKNNPWLPIILTLQSYRIAQQKKSRLLSFTSKRKYGMVYLQTCFMESWIYYDSCNIGHKKYISPTKQKA